LAVEEGAKLARRKEGAKLARLVADFEVAGEIEVEPLAVEPLAKLAPSMPNFKLARDIEAEPTVTTVSAATVEGFGRCAADGGADLTVRLVSMTVASVAGHEDPDEEPQEEVQPPPSEPKPNASGTPLPVPEMVRKPVIEEDGPNPGSPPVQDHVHHSKCYPQQCNRPSCQIQVTGEGAKPWFVMRELHALVGGLYALGHQKEFVMRVVREIQKGVAHNNKEALYEDDAAVESLRRCNSPNSIGTLAYNLNVTTTDLGIVLAGKQAVYHVVRTPEDTHLLLGDTPADDEARRGWAKAAVEAADKDRIGGVRLPISRGRETADQYGDVGETKLISALERAGVARAEYQTEQDLMKAEFAEPEAEPGTRATPDVKFHKPIEIAGHTVAWIEAKNKMLIPQVSSDDELESFDKQVGRYTKRYGPGAVLWLGQTPGFCASMVGRHPEVFHFVLVVNKQGGGGSKKKKPKQKQRKASASAAKQPLSTQQSKFREEPHRPSWVKDSMHSSGARSGCGFPTAPVLYHDTPMHQFSRVRPRIQQDFELAHAGQNAFGFSGPVAGRRDPAMSTMPSQGLHGVPGEYRPFYHDLHPRHGFRLGGAEVPGPEQEDATTRRARAAAAAERRAATTTVSTASTAATATIATTAASATTATSA
jgi:hypothetical protein